MAGRGQKHFDQMIERVAIDLAASPLVLSTGYSRMPRRTAVRMSLQRTSLMRRPTRRYWGDPPAFSLYPPCCGDNDVVSVLAPKLPSTNF